MMNEDLCEINYVDEVKVQRLHGQMPAAEGVDRITSVFKTLSDPSRLRVLVALSKEELCVCDLARLLAVSRSNLSHQLRFMKAGGLVKSRRDGKMSYYSLANADVMGIVNAAFDLLSKDDAGKK